MSTAVELQTMIFDRLTADAGVTALVDGRIYDRMPSDADYPCITFGPTDMSPADMDCIDGRYETIQIDCWAVDHGRMRPAKEIADAVKASLHFYDGDMLNGALTELAVESVRVMIDADGITAHGIVVVTALIEEA